MPNQLCVMAGRLVNGVRLQPQERGNRAPILRIHGTSGTAIARADAGEERALILLEGGASRVLAPAAPAILAPRGRA